MCEESVGEGWCGRYFVCDVLSLGCYLVAVSCLGRGLRGTV